MDSSIGLEITAFYPNNVHFVYITVVGHRYGMSMLDFGHFLHPSELMAYDTAALGKPNMKAFGELPMCLIDVSC